MIFYNIAKGLLYGLFKLVYRVKIEGRENIPQGGAFVVCANHISNLDPPILGVCMPFQLTYMAKEELFKNKFFGKLISSLGAFPIQRGNGDIGALRSAIRILKDGRKMVIFPEGGRSDGTHLRIGKPGAALIAVKAEVGILPVGIVGNYKPFRKMKIRIGKIISLDEYFGKRLESSEFKRITDDEIMPAIAELAGVKTYENRDC